MVFPVLFILVIALLLIVSVMLLVILRSQHRRRMQSGMFKDPLNTNNPAKDEYYIGIAQIKKRLNHNPDDFESREQLGDCYIGVSNYQSAATEYTTVLDRQPDMTDKDKIRIMNKIGQSYMSLEKYTEAQKFFRLILRIDPQNVSASADLAKALIKLGDADKALAILKKIQPVCPSDACIAKYMGIAHYMKKEYKAAISSFSLSDNIQPLDSESLFYNGVSLLMTDSDQAVYYLERSAKDPVYGTESQYFLGKHYRGKNDYKQSNHYFSMAVAAKNINPTLYLDAYYTMGLNFADIKDLTNAAKCWQKVSDRKSDYRDVAQKLRTMGGSDTSDNVKLFRGGSPSQFSELCQRFAVFFAENDTSLKGGHFSDIQTSNTNAGLVITGKYSNADSHESYIFLFIRETEFVGDMYVRSIYKQMKNSNINKAVCVSCGVFSDVAKDFVSARMITLLEADDTNAILQKL